ncbi:uncharacterized protein LOC113949828 [Corapipo altera]|uniref:uncharacterized protein LOC113949828 n=1 Tax=Corapipo altera TaxID=415028 RepID=UPI000FD6378B|nr:uncharacterized protein LOC113949828 [Corapipo altera]
MVQIKSTVLEIVHEIPEVTKLLVSEEHERSQVEEINQEEKKKKKGTHHPNRSARGPTPGGHRLPLDAPSADSPPEAGDAHGGGWVVVRVCSPTPPPSPPRRGSSHRRGRGGTREKAPAPPARRSARGRAPPCAAPLPLCRPPGPAPLRREPVPHRVALAHPPPRGRHEERLRARRARGGGDGGGVYGVSLAALTGRREAAPPPSWSSSGRGRSKGKLSRDATGNCCQMEGDSLTPWACQGRFSPIQQSAHPHYNIPIWIQVCCGRPAESPPEVKHHFIPSLSCHEACKLCWLASKHSSALPGLEGQWKSKGGECEEALHIGNPLLLQAQKSFVEEWKSQVAFRIPESQVVHLPYGTAVIYRLGSFGPAVSLCNYTILMHICEDKPLGTNSSKYL